ncbi:MAG: aminotransferase class III-fold pyridoxal phosphate-dependent enzyme, partial [Silvanigrellaceae bacterium]|nr:aminotransferase class III-fold pyridoxal phosphate-dependent enzyme [Silvanigrellaceae bacterium]
QALGEGRIVYYVKPIQTGGACDERDDAFVKASSSSNPNLVVKNFATYAQPISPHRAARLENHVITDNAVQEYLKTYLEDCALQVSKKGGEEKTIFFIETAGGVASPTAQGNIQCQLYRPFRFPVIFIADFRLGGISTAISSYELLKAHGYDISCILCLAGEHENGAYLAQYYGKECKVFVFSNLPPRSKDTHDPQGFVQSWREQNQKQTALVISHLFHFFYQQLTRYEKIKEIALHHAWWPFTQHQTVQKPTIIDSAYLDSFQTVEVSSQTLEGQKAFLKAQKQQCFDASASWWTQGVGHGHYALARASAYAAGRYGHVLFPKNIHEPAAGLIERLLATVGKDWASRVFFSDNGSTAVEVALKMAFRKSILLCQERFSQQKIEHNILVLGLRDSYHGDTLGAMNASSPNAFKEEEVWYTPKGIWLGYPQVYLKDGYWQVCSRNIDDPELISFLSQEKFCKLEDLFSDDRFASKCAQFYKKYLSFIVNQILQKEQQFIGALILEPIIQGSNGMIFVDPLYQKILIEIAKSLQIPV